MMVCFVRRINHNKSYSELEHIQTVGFGGSGLVLSYLRANQPRDCIQSECLIYGNGVDCLAPDALARTSHSEFT
jgi:hypothetical protein